MVKVVTYENKRYLLRRSGLEPILYLHLKKNLVIIRTKAGLYIGKIADFENRKLTEREKSFVDGYAAWFLHENGEPHESLKMEREEFQQYFNNIFA